jgi:general secretion pathway protein G
VEEKFLNNGLMQVSNGKHLLIDHFRSRGEWGHGYTLFELLVAVAMVMTFTAIAIPAFQYYKDQARRSAAIADMKSLELKIKVYEVNAGKLPDTLAEVPWGSLDPWGNPYQYLNFASAGPSWKGKARKDKFLVPLNSTYDLYSAGKDGLSKPPLTAKTSQDDIVRANDGDYMGLASEY